jgi:ParB family chromosome partitioning protein
MEVVDIPLDKLRPVPWNPNSMTPDMLARLKASLERYGVVENLVVRPLSSGEYEVLSGNQRLKVLHELGYSSAPCVVVDLDNAQARLLAQALNRIQGEDDPGMKAELVRQVLESIDSEDVLSLLPETQDSLEELASLGQETLEDHLQAWQQSQAGKLKHFAVQLTEDQLDVVEEALKTILPHAKTMKDENPNLRGNALFLVCKTYLKDVDTVGERA